MKTKRFGLTIVVLFLLSLISVQPVLAQNITIDGNFADWAPEMGYVDPGGMDDETSPVRADITEFRAAASSGGLFLLKAWDNTSFTGGQATTAGVTMRGIANTYFRIYSTAQGLGSVPLSSLDINACADSTCKGQTDTCQGTGCTGAQAGSGPTWTDPFASRPTPDCAGTNCGTLDTAVELYIPWTFIGGAPADGQTVFLQFGSYPSGPAQAPKDDTGPNGITCRNNAGTFSCFPSNPSAITLLELAASTRAALPSAAGMAVGGLLVLSTLLAARKLTGRVGSAVK